MIGHDNSIYITVEQARYVRSLMRAVRPGLTEEDKSRLELDEFIARLEYRIEQGD
jgi:hypothetical protein